MNAGFIINAYSIANKETFYKKVKRAIIMKYIGRSYIYSVGASVFTIIMQRAEKAHVNTETYYILISDLVLFTPIFDIIANTKALPNASIFPYILNLNI